MVIKMDLLRGLQNNTFQYNPDLATRALSLLRTRSSFTLKLIAGQEDLKGRIDICVGSFLRIADPFIWQRGMFSRISEARIDYFCTWKYHDVLYSRTMHIISAIY